MTRHDEAKELAHYIYCTDIEEPEIVEAIEAALKARDERAAKIAQTQITYPTPAAQLATDSIVRAILDEERE